MVYSVKASITPKAAARLLISNEINLVDSWSNNMASKVLNELLSFSIDDILQIIDRNNYGLVAEVKFIPQYGKIKTVASVPEYFSKKGTPSADYAQMGFFLKPDVNASLAANTKFGENHGKAADLLGIACCIDKRFQPSALSLAFCSFNNIQKEELATRLQFRIPVIQILLCEAQNGVINGYAPMSLLMKSTRYRRGQCIRAIFKGLRQYNNKELNRRIDNIFWENE